MSKYIVMDYAENGDLFDFIIALNGEPPFVEELARFYFMQLLSALEYLHVD